MPKKKSHIIINLFLRMALTLFTLPLLSMVFTTNALASTHHSEVPKQYLALGDSLAFGYQPGQTIAQDYQHSYANDLFQTLQAKQGFVASTNGGCPGETSSTFINGGICYPSPTSQLAAALAYLKQNAHTVSLVTVQLGANDLLGTFNLANCTVNTTVFNANLTTLDYNLTQIILPQLYDALNDTGDHYTDLVLVEYYNPFQLLCPSIGSYIQEINDHLVGDAVEYAEAVDVYDAFNQTNLCTLTWICNNPPDIHPTTPGYQVIADRIYDEIYAGRD